MIPDGVYFSLPEEAYHADDALGSTDLKAIFLNPVQWQFARLADLRESIGLGDEEDGKESAAKRFGRAVHTMVLEGADAFAERHCVEPEKPAGLLRTIDDMKVAIKDSGLTVPARDKVMSQWKSADWFDVCREMGIGPLADDWEREKGALIGERDVVSQRWWATIALIGKMLDTPRERLGGKSQREAVISGGYPEVSVFATDDDGLRLKCRFDYLAPKFCADVKTFAARDGRELIDSFAGSVSQFAYDMQAAHYRDMRRRIPTLAMAGKVFRGEGHEPTAEHLAFVRKVAAQPDPAWLWLTVQTAGCPETDVLELPPGSLVLASAEVMVAEAKSKFAAYRDRFGMDALWQTDRGLIRMEDVVFNSSITSRGARRWELAA